MSQQYISDLECGLCNPTIARRMSVPTSPTQGMSGYPSNLFDIVRKHIIGQCMSDGPYKTLPMRPRWKVTAKRAYLEACSTEEVAEALGPALSTDWRSEVSQSLIGRLTRMLTDEQEMSLFPQQKARDVEALAGSCASPMESSILSATVDAIIEGHQGLEALQRGAEGALEERCLNAFRQIEEHMAGEASAKRTRFVRGRLEGSLAGARLTSIAQKLLAKEPAPNASLRRSDLDDGVAIRP